MRTIVFDAWERAFMIGCMIAFLGVLLVKAGRFYLMRADFRYCKLDSLNEAWFE